MVISLTTLRTFFVFLLLSLSASHAVAKTQSGLSSGKPDTKALAVQLKVDVLFDKGNYKRAFFIYRNELAPIGDKYAQYMIGFMYQVGLGVAEDRVLASAWYRIAAERDTPEFVAVKNRLMRHFTAEQIIRSDQLFADLRLEFSDIAVLIQSIVEDARELESRTGSRIGGESSSVAVLSSRSSSVRSRADYYRYIERRLTDELEKLATIDGFEDIDTNAKTVNVRALQRKVDEYFKTRKYRESPD